MSRVRTGSIRRRRHAKWLTRAKGYRGTRRKVFKLAKQAVLKAGQYSYRDRRKKKTQFRQQWQVAINAGARQNDISYSKLIHSLKSSDVQLNRKMLADLAEHHPETFAQILDQVKTS